MNVVMVPVLMMACVSLCAGLFYLAIFIRRRNEKEKLHFALSCFIVAIYDVFCTGLYNASSLEEGILWQRLQLASIALLIIAFVWFVHHLTGAPSSRMPKFFTWCGLAFFLGGLAIHNEWTVSATTPSIKEISLPGRIAVTYYESDLGIVYMLQMFVTLWAYLWILVGLKRFFSSRGGRVRPIIAAFVLFFLSVLNDISVASGIYQFVYLAEYFYLGIIISMAYVLLNRFIDMQFEVESLNLNLEKKVEYKTDELRAAMEELESINDALITSNRELEEAHRTASLDMAMAANVQKILFGRSIPALAGWDVAYRFKASSGVSGDLYDFYIKGDLLEGMALFDVSGHGISSGLFTLLARSILFRNFNQGRTQSLGEILGMVNRELQDEIQDVDNYLSGIMIRISGDCVEYVNAAHPPLLIRKNSSGYCGDALPAGRTLSGSLLGLRDIEAVFDVHEFHVASGDLLLLYTDGVTECGAAHGGMFGLEGLIDCLRRAPGGDAAAIVRFIVDEVVRFNHGDDFTDDATVLVARKL
jgi:sigma-B regulation protein RsbU (phosphoserine phosphatase)